MQKYRFLVVALVCWMLAGLLARYAFAGTYALTTTAQQDEALQFVVDKENARRAAVLPTPLPSITIEQYLQQIVTTAIPSYRAQFRQERVFDKLRDAWPTLTTPQKEGICNALGVTAANCPK